MVNNLLLYISGILLGGNEAPGVLPQLGIVVGGKIGRGVTQVDASIILLGDDTKVCTCVLLGVETFVGRRETNAVGAIVLLLEGEELIHIIALVAVYPNTLDTIKEGVHLRALILYRIGQIIRDVVQFVLLDPYFVTLGGVYTGSGTPIVGAQEEGVGLGIVKIKCFVCLQLNGSWRCRFGPLGMQAHTHQ